MLRSYVITAYKRITQSRILRSSSAIMVGNTASTGILFLLSIFLARRLGAEAYGMMVLATTIVKGTMRFLDIQSDDAIIKFMGEAATKGQKEEAMAYFYVGFVADAAVMAATIIILLAAMPVIESIYGSNELLITLVKIYLFSVPFSLLDNIFGTVLAVFRRFYLLAALATANKLVQAICVLILTLQGNVAMTMWGYVIASVIVFIEQVALGIYVLYAELGTFKGRDFATTWRRFLPFVFHTNLIGYLKSIFSNADILILGALRPASEVSFFNIATNAVKTINLALGPVGTVVFPKLNEEWVKGNQTRVKQLLGRYTLLSTTISAIGALCLLIMGQWLVLFFYGPDYVPVVPVIDVLAIGMLINNIIPWVRDVAFAANKPHLVSFVSLTSVIVRVATLVSLISLYGMIGAAFGTVISNTISVIIVLIFVLPNIGLSKLGRLSDT